jgi:hypothetical protein
LTFFKKGEMYVLNSFRIMSYLKGANYECEQKMCNDCVDGGFAWSGSVRQWLQEARDSRQQSRNSHGRER